MTLSKISERKADFSRDMEKGSWFAKTVAKAVYAGKIRWLNCFVAVF